MKTGNLEQSICVLSNLGEFFTYYCNQGQFVGSKERVIPSVLTRQLCSQLLCPSARGGVTWNVRNTWPQSIHEDCGKYLPTLLAMTLNPWFLKQEMQPVTLENRAPGKEVVLLSKKSWGILLQGGHGPLCKMVNWLWMSKMFVRF